MIDGSGACCAYFMAYLFVPHDACYPAARSAVGVCAPRSTNDATHTRLRDAFFCLIHTRATPPPRGESKRYVYLWMLIHTPLEIG